ncbi:glycoside hydrolase family 16 [Colletotrichum scovillei]|uniref:glycoside hydrolase family 16 n=1 Tax=Colletotrichum scovillei TaxID=1209932 RepID=UPI0015C33BE4|nr:glycoside hydrolase family 16 [Colletotrichum scovillei]KAF4780186.1 glycoside hydrolase family 16 [Colletotrichum scovillei]
MVWLNQAALFLGSALLVADVLPVGAVRTIIPKTSFDSQSNFDADWNYLYPWGTDHNGGARMTKDNVKFSGGTLTITANKEHFNVSRGGGYDFSAEIKATTTKGTWPAFWLTAVQGWPPEIDMAEWKGSGKVSFNTFNTSSIVAAKDVTYPSPGNFHSFKCETRDLNGKDVQAKFYMDGNLITTQVGAGYFGKPMYLIINLQMEGSSGSPGPTSNTEYQVRNLEVLSYNP